MDTSKSRLLQKSVGEDYIYDSFRPLCICGNAIVVMVMVMPLW